MLRPQNSEREPENPATAAKSRSLGRIRQLQGLSRHSLWGLTFFLIISVVAMPQSSLLPAIPRSVREFLGSAPPANLVSIALVIYSFSALVLILSRMGSGSGKFRGWSHLGYLTAFYAFYYYGDSLDSNFWAIFTAGITIMSLEHYHIWSYCSENIRKEKEFMAQTERKEAFISARDRE